MLLKSHAGHFIGGGGLRLAQPSCLGTVEAVQPLGDKGSLLPAWCCREWKEVPAECPK